MPLAFSLFDFDGLDGLIVDSTGLLMIVVVVLALTIGFVVAREVIERHRSPVGKLMKRRLG